MPTHVDFGHDRSTTTRADRPGYVWHAAFEGAAPCWRPGLAYVAELLRRNWGTRTLGTLHGGQTIVVCGGYEQHYRWWAICDNGGELNVHEINRVGLQPPSVPYTQHGLLVPIGRLAWFCAMTICGEPIDYGYSGVDDIVLDDA